MRPNITDLFQNGSSTVRNGKIASKLSVLQWRQTYQSSEYYKLLLDNGNEISLRQILNGESKGLGTGTFVWPAAHVLSKYLEKRFMASSDLGSSDLGMAGLSVCDIGTGTGCTGFVAALLGATVTLTDQECVLFLLQENRNSFLERFSTLVEPARVMTELYEWGTGRPHWANSDFDYILVSDCVLPKLYPIDLLLQARYSFLKFSY
jgi:hypothetical protein